MKIKTKRKILRGAITLFLIVSTFFVLSLGVNGGMKTIIDSYIPGTEANQQLVGRQFTFLEKLYLSAMTFIPVLSISYILLSNERRGVMK